MAVFLTSGLSFAYLPVFGFPFENLTRSCSIQVVLISSVLKKITKKRNDRDTKRWTPTRVWLRLVRESALFAFKSGSVGAQRFVGFWCLNEHELMVCLNLIWVRLNSCTQLCLCEFTTQCAAGMLLQAT